MIPNKLRTLHVGEQFDHVAISHRDTLAWLMQSNYDFSRDMFTKMTRMDDRSLLEDNIARIRPILLNNPQIPADLREAAERHSRELVFSLATMTSAIKRHQAHGSLDSSKLSRLARPGISAPEFDRLTATAFKRRDSVQRETTRPRVAIVADMNQSIRESNLGYEARTGALAYVIAEAAKIAGVEVALYGSRGTTSQIRHASVGSTPERLHVPVIIKDWQEEIGGAELALVRTPGAFPIPLRAAGCGMMSKNGTGGIEWARMQGANFVVAIGTFFDRARPDVHLSPKLSVEAAILLIVETLTTRRAA